MVEARVEPHFIDEAESCRGGLLVKALHLFGEIARGDKVRVTLEAVFSDLEMVPSWQHRDDDVPLSDRLGESLHRQGEDVDVGLFGVSKSGFCFRNSPVPDLQF